MSRYTSKHTGPEIDDAVDRANGYGLGGVAKWLEPTDNLNNIKTTGWYRWFNRPINAPGEFGAMTVVVTAPDGGLVQEVVFVLPKFNGTSNHTVNCKVRRVCYENTWQPWEWVNPPMMLEAEYRTTERYQGKPVYTTMRPSVALGSAGSTVYIEGLPGGIEDVIDYRIQFQYSNGKTFAVNNWSKVTVQMVHDSSGYAWAAIKCIEDCSNNKATGTFKYTKTTG